VRVVRSVREREPRTSRRCRNRVRLFQIKEAEWTALDEISPEPEGLLLTSAEPGAGLSALEDSMPASWAFLFWLLDALVEDFISPEAPHREETQISVRSCPFGRGSESKWTSFQFRKK
jgi:hypothetical protein